MYLLFSTDNFALFNSSSEYAKGKIRGIFSPPVLATLHTQINLFSWTMSAMWLFPSNTTSGFLVKAEATYPTFNASYRFCPSAFPALEPGAWPFKVSLLVGLGCPFKHVWSTVAQYCSPISFSWNEFSSFSLPSEPYPWFQVQGKSHLLSEVLPFQPISQSLYLVVICIEFIIFASQFIFILFLVFLINYLNIYIFLHINLTLIRIETLF